MAKQAQTVDAFLAQLNHPMQAEIERVRRIILGADAAITEHVKWNAPSFCYAGEDRVTMRLHPPQQLQLVFHRGAKVRSDGDAFRFEDETGLLQWVSNDRATVTLRSMAEIDTKAAALTQVVQQWITR